MQSASPFPHRYWNDPAHAGMQGGDPDKRLLHHPVDRRPGKFFLRIGHSRALMDYIAERRRFDKKYSHGHRLIFQEIAARGRPAGNINAWAKIRIAACKLYGIPPLADRPKAALSAVLITKNAAARLEGCLESLRFCDEIVIVDSGSSDGTCEIAKRFGAQLIERDWLGFGRQKQYAVDQASHDWVLCIDADERITSELASSIGNALVNPVAPVYRMSRRNRFLGRWLRHGEGYPDWSARLFDRRSARWSDDPVHEKVLYAVTPGTLQGDLLHESAEDLREYLDKQNRYTSLAARQLFDSGQSASVAQLIASPLVRFVKFYFLRLGVLDGLPGLAHTTIGCMNSFMKYAKLAELHRLKNTGRQ